jgi:hypothetical protein
LPIKTPGKGILVTEPNETTSQGLAPFTVGQLVISAIEAFFSAAALHLGESLPDGRKLDQTDPMEAWRALLGASALLNQLGPLMADAKLVPYQAGLDHLLAKLAAEYPTTRFPVPAWLPEAVQRASQSEPIGNLTEAVRRGLAQAETPGQSFQASATTAPPGQPSSQAKPSVRPPGTGLPAKRSGSGPLFPR